MKDDKPFSYRLGQFLGGVLLTCAVVCIAGLLIALTLKFLVWIF